MSRKPKATAPKEETTPTLVPKLRFPEFREAEGWKERLIGEFLSESRLPGSKGNVAKKITVKLWGNGVFEKNESIQGSINTQYFQRKAGQFIYSKLDFLNQAFGIIPRSLDNFESTVDLPCFDIRQGLNPLFFLEYVKRRDFYERLGETADGSRKARRIHAETFLSFSVALPTPSEQQKIAECLSSVDDLIAAQARKVDALKTHKKGLIQQLFPREGETQPRLRFPEFRGQEEWRLQRVCEVAGYENGKAHENDISDHGIYIVVNSKFISTEGKVKKYSNEGHCLACTGDVLMVLSDVPNGRAIAKCFYVNFDNLYTVNQRVCKIQPSNGDGKFLYYLLDRNVYFLAFDDGVKQTNLRKEDVLSCPLILPPTLLEQQRIAACLSSLDGLITAEGQKLEGLKTHKRGLMQQLFPSVVEA